MTMRPPPRASRPGDAPHVHDLLSAYVDDALPAAEAATVAEHLTTCAPCSHDYQAMLATVASLRETLPRYTAPDTLQHRVRAALRETTAGTVRDEAPPVRRRGLTPAWRWGIAASFLVAVLSSAATYAVTDAARDRASTREAVLTSHIRSLMPDHLTDIRSNDQHNVKPWFNGRLDYSPAVPRFDDRGFPLLGGRLDYVAGRPVAVVVYGRRQHVINVYSWPTTARDAAASSGASHGYHTVAWRSGGAEYWVVSDLNAAELAQFAGMLREGMR
jgi:anti-sigma factor RsiW